MIYLVTGTPGAGKTSNTLWDFLFNPAYKGRPKFATDIKGFDYEGQGVTKLDSLENWRDLPSGALVLVDEADRYIPAVGRSTEMPDWIREFARSRHYGIDFFFITQLHTMIHHHVRALIESHIHYHRSFGLEATTRYKWETLQNNVNSSYAREQAQKQRIKVNPKIFTLYKSTELDTRKVHLPWKWIITAAVGVAVIIFALFFVRHLFSRHQAAVAATTAAVPASASAPGVPVNAQQLSSAPVGSRLPDMSMKKIAYTAADFKPRIPLDPSTVPIYDNISQPSDFPRVAACMASSRGCNCFTQQATPVDVPDNICRLMVQRGWFDRWRTARAQQDVVLAGRSDEASARAQQQQQPSFVVNRPESVVIGGQSVPVSQ